MKKIIFTLALLLFLSFPIDTHAADGDFDGDIPIYIPEDFIFPSLQADVQEPSVYDKLVDWYDSVIGGIFKPSQSTLQSGTIAFNSIGGYGQLSNQYLQDALLFKTFNLSTSSTYFLVRGYSLSDHVNLEFTAFNYDSYALRNYGQNVSICMLGYVSDGGKVIFGTFWRDGLFYPLSASMTMSSSSFSSNSSFEFSSSQKDADYFQNYNTSAANYGNNSSVTLGSISMTNIPIFNSYSDLQAFIANPFVYPSGLANSMYADFNGLVFNPYTPLIGSNPGDNPDLDTSGIISFLKSGFGLFGQDGFIPMMVSAFRFIPEKVSTAIGMGTLVILLVIAFKIAL